MRQYRLFDAGMMKTMNKKTTNFLELRIPSCRCTSDVRGCQWHMHSGSDDLTHRIPRIISQEYYYISKRMVENDWVFLLYCMKENLCFLFSSIDSLDFSHVLYSNHAYFSSMPINNKVFMLNLNVLQKKRKRTQRNEHYQHQDKANKENTTVATNTQRELWKTTQW